jgi:hypothetical protein
VRCLRRQNPRDTVAANNRDLTPSHERGGELLSSETRIHATLLLEFLFNAKHGLAVALRVEFGIGSNRRNRFSSASSSFNATSASARSLLLSRPAPCRSRRNSWSMDFSIATASTSAVARSERGRGLAPSHLGNKLQ